MSEYTPTTGHVRVAYQDHQDFQAVIKGLDRPGDVEAGREFDRFIARVRRDAAREALDGLIAWHRENAQDAETPAPIRRGVAVMADEAQRYRDTHYPETEDQT